MVMPDKKESIEDIVARVVGKAFEERDRRVDQERKRKEDPWGAIADLMDERIKAARDADVEAEESEPKQRRSKSDDEPEEGGFFAQIIGGGGR